MGITVSTIIDKVALLIEDVYFDLFTRAEVLREINSVQREHVSTRQLGYTRRQQIEVVEGQTIYEFPGDLIRMTHAYINSPTTTTKKPVREGVMGYSEPIEGQEPMIYRERVSGHEFEFLPLIDPEKLAASIGGTVSSGMVPDSNQENNVWVDEDGVIYWCSAGYDEADAETSMTLTTGRLVPLEFVAVAKGAYIEIEIDRGGASGTSTLAKTGSGTYDDPTQYKFTLFDNNSSNNDIIALLSGDADLTASGASATDVSVVAIGSTPMTRIHESNYTALSIEIHYHAELPDFFSETDEIHPSVGNPMRTGNALAMLAAANLLINSRGSVQQAQIYRQEGSALLSESAYLQRRGMRPVAMAGRRIRR